MQPVDFDIRKSILNATGNIVISASAGTGKTYITVLRIIEDIACHNDFQTFAAITFTRKATKKY
jgi:ATP-dependent exoDNAse (exonuclease V) beta subunit